FGFALQVLPEHSPGCIGYSKGQTMASYHVGRFQVFNNDGLIVLDIVMRGFMEGILALVVNTLVETSNLLLGFVASVASLFTTGELLLSLTEFLGTFLAMYGIVDDVPISISHEVTDTHIKPDSVVFQGQGLRFGLANTLEVPARGTQDDTSKLELTFKGTVQDDANMAATQLRCK